jgi:exodeoxyribonuclease V alpha subunit
MTEPLDVDAGAQRLARGFAEQVERWARRHGAPAPAIAAAARAAHAVSLATSAGHTCLPLADAFAATLPSDDTTAARALLLASGVVTTPDHAAPMPLVLDADGRLYLHRYFDHERRLAARLLDIARRPPTPPQPSAAQRLHELFATLAGAPPAVPPAVPPAAPPAGPDWQRIAAALALHRRLCVISGGPGTGKTTTVAIVLACLLEQQPDCRIALAAPTGKAAARMMEALNARAAQLPEALRRRLPTQAQTLHRLLGAAPRGNGPRHHRGHPLPLDVLIVDEASMLDLALAAQLFDALPDDARVILLGDKDQLAAVEAGAVFAEVSADPSLDAATRDAVAMLCGIDAPSIAPPTASLTPLANSTVWLTQTHRFASGSGIGALAAAINAGDAPAVAALLHAGRDTALLMLDDDRALLAHVRDGYAPFIDALHTNAGDVAAIARAFDRFRVLCAVREGPRGVHAMNRHCEQWVRGAAAGVSPWYPGRAVMVTRNDPLLGLFNGDVGIALPDAQNLLQVHFASPDGGWRAIAPARLPEHETAFAITVHKAQGSEFDRVAVVLPTQPSPVVTRELLYTAVTRARQEVALCSSPQVLEQAVTRRTFRHSGLLARLQELR